jgi:hypothetical protein
MKRNYMVVDAANKTASDYFESKEDAKKARNELQGELAPMGGMPREEPHKDGDKGKPSGRDRRESWKFRVSYGPDHWRNAS